MNEENLGIARHILTALGGGLVTSGAMSADNLNLAVGAILTLTGIVWSVIQKRQAAQTLAVAVASPAA